jgi:hypothetical protein
MRRRSSPRCATPIAGSYAATHRVMLNEEQLAHRLRAAGFELIQTHTMSLRQQVEAFSSADFIVGAAGSAMFNVVFSHPGTKLVDIEPHWIFGHTNLFGSCGLDHGIFEAKAQISGLEHSSQALHGERGSPDGSDRHPLRDPGLTRCGFCTLASTVFIRKDAWLTDQ